jgi:hypothetical protein
MTRRELDYLNLIQLIDLLELETYEQVKLERARCQNASDRAKRLHSTLEYIHGVSGNRV